MKITGALTALITPFQNGKIDEQAYREFIEWQIVSGIDGLVPCGTTGESATLSHAEHKQAIKICVDQVKGRVPVLAGSGSNNTAEAIELTRYAREAGADAALLITPYYNKPTQDGMVAHFKAIAAEVPMPFILYNVPGRTGVNLLPPTVARLNREIPDLIGIKEATGDLKQASDILEQCGPQFTLLSGDDFTVLPLLSIGGQGVISVVSNIAPKEMSRLCSCYAKGDTATAQKLHYELAPLCRAMFIQTNPIPVKTVAWLMGKVGPEMRLPLLAMDTKNQDKLRAALEQTGLL